MAGIGQSRNSSVVGFGVVGAVETDRPLVAADPYAPSSDSATFWACVWFVVAIVALYVIL